MSRESPLAAAKRRAHLRARQRAWAQLGREHPERFRELYLAELQREGWDGDEDLRAGANLRRGARVWRKVLCDCGWTGSRKLGPNLTALPCPRCGGTVRPWARLSNDPRAHAR
jgi:hypothetical protein